MRKKRRFADPFGQQCRLFSSSSKLFGTSNRQSLPKHMVRLLVVFVFLVQRVSCQSPCTDPGLGGSLIVPEDTICVIDLPGLNGTLENVEVRGTLVLMSNESSYVVLEAESVTVFTTGVITADGLGFESGLGPGAGNAEGSGGKSRDGLRFYVHSTAIILGCKGASTLWW